MGKKTLVVLLVVFVIMLLPATAAFAGGDYCNYDDGSPGPGYSDLGSFASNLAKADQGIGSSNALRIRHGNSACPDQNRKLPATFQSKKGGNVTALF